MRFLNQLNRLWIIIFWITCSIHLSYAMLPLTEDEMRTSHAQSLFVMNYIAPEDRGNLNKDLGFYRFQFNINMEINTNIKHLQLGCGGSKGPGCDIDMENISLVGTTPINGNYASTDALINNPFLEFAIKSPESSAMREVVGIRFGALSALGKLGVGSNQDLTSLSDDIRGINTLSGELNLTLSNTVLNNISIENGLVLTKAYIKNHEEDLILNRANTVTLSKIKAVTDSLNILGILPLPGGLQLNNITLKDYPLYGFHEILIAQDNAGTIPTQDLSLSLQKQAINWQKISTGSFENTVAAQPGWWISLPKVIITDIETQQRINIPLTDALGGIFNREIVIQPLDSGQKGIINCYGALKFC